MKKINIISSEPPNNTFPEKVTFSKNTNGTVLVLSYVHRTISDTCTIQNEIHSFVESEFQVVRNNTDMYSFQSRILQSVSYMLWNFNQNNQNHIRMSITVILCTEITLFYTSVGTGRLYLLRESEVLLKLQSTNNSAIPIGADPFCSPSIQLIPLESNDVVFSRSSSLQHLLPDEELLQIFKRSMELVPNTENALDTLIYSIKQKKFDSKNEIEEFQLILLEIQEMSEIIQKVENDILRFPTFNAIVASLLMVTFVLSTTCFLLYKEVKKLHRTTDVLLERNEEILMNTSTKYMPQIEQLLESNKKRIENDSNRVVTELTAHSKNSEISPED